MVEQAAESWMGAVAFGDDGSQEADEAWRWINSQKWGGWNLDVLTSVAVTGGPPTHDESVPQEWQPEHPRVPSPDAAIGRIRYLKVHQDPRLMLWEADAVTVIGPRGHGLWKALALGSTAEFLIAHPRTPLVIARNSRPVQHVLMAHDGSEHAISARKALCKMPWFKDCTVTLLVVDDGRVDVDEVVAKTKHFIEADAGVTSVKVLREVGNPTDGVLNAMDDIHPDLIVMGTRGRTGLQRIYIGSTASAVSRSANCPVLVNSAD